ncbi:MAG: hypothetical protein LAN71_04835 [Acidobacteriia bacterium]|nr:hypothetical protein [Terriglobia bacterium]
MKVFSSVLALVALSVLVSPSLRAEPHQVLQGTQVHLSLLNPVGTSGARDGDPFIAVVVEPVFLGPQLLLPAGTRVHGVIGTVGKPRRFSLFRGQAYLNLAFRSIEVDSRLVPVRMSILAIEKPHGQSAGDSSGKPRRDIRIIEGQVLQARHDVKGDVTAGAIGAGGGTLAGAIFGTAMKGMGLGIAGSAVYIVARKGREVELPAQTGLLVRVDTTVTVPVTVASNDNRLSLPAR